MLVLTLLPPTQLSLTHTLLQTSLDLPYTGLHLDWTGQILFRKLTLAPGQDCVMTTDYSGGQDIVATIY